METLLNQIPSISEILNIGKIKGLINHYPRWIVINEVREVINERRNSLIKHKKVSPENKIESYVKDVIKRFDLLKETSLKSVVNCSGIIINTNLGRSPLATSAVRNLANAGSFSNLEFDLDRGKRSSRSVHWNLLTLLTGSEEVLVVNNNAAALLLILSTLAKKKEVIISRGEIVEIGDGFRINEILKASGAKLLEVGTTNRTRVADYREAITEKTGAILKVHTSNYKIIGFEESTSLENLIELGLEKNIPVIHDAGSGLLTDLTKNGLKNEPNIKEAIDCGCEIVAFSADKLLGGPQAGIIAGKRKFLTKMKKNPLYRALRVCKLTLLGLEETLKHYIRGDEKKEIPVLKMIDRDISDIENDSRLLRNELKERDRKKVFHIDIKKDESYIGGGSNPGITLETRVISLQSDFSPNRIAKMFRTFETPIIGRIKDNEVLLDLRTVLKHETKLIKNAFSFILDELKGK